MSLKSLFVLPIVLVRFVALSLVILAAVSVAVFLYGTGSSKLPAIEFNSKTETVAEKTWSLFKLQDAKVVQEKTVVRKLPPSRLNVDLIGVVGGPLKRIAVINKGRSVVSLKVGQVLIDNWEAEEINVDSVVLKKGVERQLLSLKRFDPKNAKIEVSSRNKQSKGITPASIGMSIVRSESGEPAIAVSGVEPDLIASLGLKSDDLIMSVATVKAVDLYEDPDAYRSLLAQTEWSVVIERDGKQENIVIQLSSLLAIVGKLK
ncbi:hypothetical protein XMG59_002229 [Marinobacterium sp. xm-g-59]|uniref:type II secretion system protein N n=1 Tax=Marinobacterium sp. xm-g-59 TaxID=2497748 RepID=UPI001567E49C|nr:type II secretion system protein N [Marinobacterium sp. xm-g-59]NRP96111.1 hypothetical protein [Marinobacterium sp. xm-g-59]